MDGWILRITSLYSCYVGVNKFDEVKRISNQQFNDDDKLDDDDKDDENGDDDDLDEDGKISCHV